LPEDIEIKNPTIATPVAVLTPVTPIQAPETQEKVQKEKTPQKTPAPESNEKP